VVKALFPDSDKGVVRHTFRHTAATYAAVRGQKASLNEPVRLRSSSYGETAFALRTLAGLPSRSAKAGLPSRSPQGEGW
jgi:hypothetical protein